MCWYFLVHWDGLKKGNGYKMVCMLRETETPVKQQYYDHGERRNIPLFDRYSMEILLTKVE